MLEKFEAEAENVKLIASLGMVKYLSAVKYSQFMLGNSSSGIIEAPALGIPTVNIGDRQKGCLMADTIISCGNKTEEIVDAMRKAVDTEYKISGLYGYGNTSEKMIAVIIDFLLNEKIDLKKKFYDIPQN